MSCEQCTLDPWLNLSSEVPDRDRNINIVNFVQRPPLGWEYRAVGCQRTCVSEVSQEDANECALALAQECLYSDWSPPRTPGTPFQPAPIYTNSAQTCIIQCSNGQEVSVGGENTFSWTVPAGTVIQLSEAEANTLANSLACAQARNHRICISSTLAGGCIDTPYRQRIIATGGVPAFFPFTGFNIPFGCSADATAGDRGAFSPIPYAWSLVGGALPPGLELRPCTGYIKGTPTTTGIYSFTVKAVDAIGSFQIKTLTLVILEIDNDTPMPQAVLNEQYAEILTLAVSPGEETWELVSGSLPPGLTLDPSGVISGVPTGPLASYQFTIKVTTNP